MSSNVVGHHKRRILLLENNPSGHHLAYIRILADAASANGDEVYLGVSSDVLNSAEFGVHMSGITGRVKSLSYEDESPKGVAALANRVSANLTVVPDGDHIALRLGLSKGWQGHGELSLLLMRDSLQPSRVWGWARLKLMLKNVLIQRVSAFANVTLVRLRSSTWIEHQQGVAFDPISVSVSPERREVLARAWALTDDRYWFGVLGAISFRKNVALVARSLLSSGCESPGLLLAGKPDPGVLESAAVELDALRRAGIPVRIVDRLLTEVELDAAVASVDCVVLAHSNENPSGIMGKAAVAGTRVLAAGAKALQEDCLTMPGLAHWVPLDERHIGEGLRVASKAEKPLPSGVSGTFQFSEAMLGRNAREA
jgi:hypothetical protein